MNDKTKRIILITACCLLCGVAVIGIAGRFGGNTVTPSGTVMALSGREGFSTNTTETGSPSSPAICFTDCTGTMRQLSTWLPWKL